MKSKLGILFIILCLPILVFAQTNTINTNGNMSKPVDTNITYPTYPPCPYDRNISMPVDANISHRYDINITYPCTPYPYDGNVSIYKNMPNLLSNIKIISSKINTLIYFAKFCDTNRTMDANLCVIPHQAFDVELIDLENLLIKINTTQLDNNYSIPISKALTTIKDIKIEIYQDIYI